MLYPSGGRMQAVGGVDWGLGAGDWPATRNYRAATAWDHHEMASAITHFVVGAAFALPATESATLRSVLPVWAIPIGAGLLAVAPDLDTYVMRAFRLPYGSFFGH